MLDNSNRLDKCIVKNPEELATASVKGIGKMPGALELANAYHDAIGCQTN